MPPIGKVAPSRAGKRQVLCYVDAPTLDAVKRGAALRMETLQQCLAKAVTDELGRLGTDLRISCERRHLFVRVKKAAQPRLQAGVRPSRYGRKAIAGWFDRIEVDAASEFAAEIGSSLQEIASRGLARLAARSPVPSAASLPPTDPPPAEAPFALALA